MLLKQLTGVNYMVHNMLFMLSLRHMLGGLGKLRNFVVKGAVYINEFQPIEGQGLPTDSWHHIKLFRRQT